ncbi:rust resistance kinase Lr10-like [Tripterygium wilfordii]|uniref:rust resistance kinase Lr10-like n=1 Tax=Tripterygium wilfordii TaxID=458696 RepID=UPI0018F854A9|nr:rust resistance kinase Lr10-like [Tripterygium wilfordii]
MFQIKLLLHLPFLALLFHTSFSSAPPGNITYTCTHHSSCGDIANITYPFRLKSSPSNCGDRNYEVSCENNRTIVELGFRKYVVKAINYKKRTIRVADIGVQENNCSSFPLYSLSPNGNFYSINGPYYIADWSNIEQIAFVSCETPMKSPSFVDTAPCIGSNSSLSFYKRRYHYVIVDRIEVVEMGDFCVVDIVAMTTLLRGNKRNFTYMDIHRELAYGLELSWDTIDCEGCRGIGYCEFYNNTIIHNCIFPKGRDFQWFISKIGFFFRALVFVLQYFVAPFVIGPCIGLRTIVGFPCLFGFLIYKWRRRHLSMDDSLEEFLRNQHNLMPIRYSYTEIKKMSKRFEKKLGEGGYGTVYLGKLRSGRFVAIKMLGKSKANGQDFINEVATIGRIHHVNVVRLIGFCAEGSNRALVYDFMPKGSLDKYIFSKEGYNSLSWKKMYEISLGVARGIEYLHRGCEMQILHFDIKPHNILLDENFVPKISDFGLAKLYPTDNSIVTLTAARGTIGYIAPELIYKKIGGVSYKADVYSFGMLLMEMAGKRKKLVSTTENSSQISYFPNLVYDEIINGKVAEIEDTSEEEESIVKKMMIVALWCIQISPSDRPSMRKAIQMLEADTQHLRLPPKPSLSLEGMLPAAEDAEESTDPTWSSFASNATAESVRLIVNTE